VPEDIELDVLFLSENEPYWHIAFLIAIDHGIGKEAVSYYLFKNNN